jgi:hypothetical protein
MQPGGQRCGARCIASSSHRRRRRKFKIGCCVTRAKGDLVSREHVLSLLAPHTHTPPQVLVSVFIATDGPPASHARAAHSEINVRALVPAMSGMRARNLHLRGQSKHEMLFFF